MNDPHATTRKEFGRQAATLESAEAFTDDALLARIRDAASLARTDRLLDVGSGPGIVSVGLASAARDVIALDLTRPMLDRVRDRAARLGASNVRPVLGSGETLPFGDGGFDCVVARLAIHHFPEPTVVLGEITRVTRPGGRVVIVDVVSSETRDESSLHNALEALRDPSHARMLPRSELVTAIRSAGLRVSSQTTWQKVRRFDEWIRIVDAPERVEPLRTLMSVLARAGLDAGIDLHMEGGIPTFLHHFVQLVAVKPG
jgi:ubiquinone/menaquinone biosynthesis C-methylase UbiE